MKVLFGMEAVFGVGVRGRERCAQLLSRVLAFVKNQGYYIAVSGTERGVSCRLFRRGRIKVVA